MDAFGYVSVIFSVVVPGLSHLLTGGVELFKPRAGEILLGTSAVGGAHLRRAHLSVVDDVEPPRWEWLPDIAQVTFSAV